MGNRRATQADPPPGVIDLGMGYPDPALLPVEAVRIAADRALRAAGADMLAYGANQGPPVLVEWLRDSIGRTEGRTPRWDEILITGGNSFTLDQLCTLCADRGDVALVESPTYHLALAILRDHPVGLVSVPADDQGLRLDALESALGDVRRSGRRPRFLYLVPTFSNPTGTSLALERRRGLIEIAARESLLIVEDDAYRELAYDGPSPPSLWSLAPTGVVARLGSFSKSLAPGLRLGWLTGDAALISKFVNGGLLDSGGGPSHFSAMAVADLCQSGAYPAVVEHLRLNYRDRLQVLVEALAARLPGGCAWVRPGGGFFVWVRVPDGLNTSALLASAHRAGVGYVPGARFHVDGGGTNTLRLSFSYYPPAELVEAVRRLGTLLGGKAPGGGV